MSISVLTGAYETATGHAPRGYQTWAFDFGDENPGEFTGRWIDARVWALREAARRGVQSVTLTTEE